MNINKQGELSATDCIVYLEGPLSPPASPSPSERPSQKPREGLLLFNRNFPTNGAFE